MLIGTMVYSFARVGDAMIMKMGDYFQHHKRWWLRLHEKSGRRHDEAVSSNDSYGPVRRRNRWG